MGELKKAKEKKQMKKASLKTPEQIKESILDNSVDCDLVALKYKGEVVAWFNTWELDKLDWFIDYDPEYDHLSLQITGMLGIKFQEIEYITIADKGE